MIPILPPVVHPVVPPVLPPVLPPAPQAAPEPEPPGEPEAAPADDTEPEAEPPPAPRERLVAHDPAVVAQPRRGAGRIATLTAIEAMNRRAVAAYRRGDYANAHRILRAALAAGVSSHLLDHPLTALTRTHLGAVLAGGFRQPELAVEQFRKALRIDPTLSLPRCYGKPQVAAAFRKAAART